MAKTIVNKENHSKLVTYDGFILIYEDFDPHSFNSFLCSV
jgi:hypothetical protein